MDTCSYEIMKIDNVKTSCIHSWLNMLALKAIFYNTETVDVYLCCF